MVLNYLPSSDPMANDGGSLARLWLSYALQDETMFLATLSFATAHRDILTKQYSSVQNLAYKNEVIKTVNKRLLSPEKAISNSTIGAVAMLAAVEVVLHKYDLHDKVLP